MSFSSLSYLNRFIFWNYPGINDYKKFSFQEISCNSGFFSFIIDEAKETDAVDKLKNIEYQYKNSMISSSLEELLISTGTTAFIIIKDDTILYEEYFNRYLRESVNTSFSTSKSITSALIGITINEGHIKSLDDRVIDWLPELRHRVSDSLSVRHLISMSSGIKYDHSYYPWADEPKSYHYPDLRKLVLSSAKQEYQPGLYFKYSNYNTILLGIILERSTSTPVCELLQSKIWKPIGMEFPATWSTDSRKNKFPKMESGINARSIDFAKFGRLILNSGRWENNQIISENWIKESTCPLDMKDKEYYFLKNYYPYSMFFNDKQLYYKYGWWGLKLDEEHYDFMAIGNLGQFIYVSPHKEMIIVRNGSKWGHVNWWPGLFRRIT